MSEPTFLKRKVDVLQQPKKKKKRAGKRERNLFESLDRIKK
jgi:hypothetical protein